MHGLRPFRRIEEQALPLQEYGRLLVALRRFHLAAHHVAGSVRIPENSRSGIRRLMLIDGDLRHLDVPFSSFECPRVRSENSALGWLYVAEGSMLRGKIIARQLDYLFGDLRQGRQFFFGAPEDGRSWRLLSKVLGELTVHGDEFETIIEGAEECFAFFESSLAEAECL